MEKKIITISRQFGSGGRSVGRLVAEKLGIPMIVESETLTPDGPTEAKECIAYLRSLEA